jgi:hypothetical protein
MSVAVRDWATAPSFRLRQFEGVASQQSAENPNTFQEGTRPTAEPPTQKMRPTLVPLPTSSRSKKKANTTHKTSNTEAVSVVNSATLMHALDAKVTEASHSMPANVSSGKENSSETQRALLRKEAPHEAAISASAVEATQMSLDEAAAVIVLEPPQKLLLSRQLLREYGLEDEADVMANNGIRRECDLRFVTDQVVKELPLSTLSKAKLKELAVSGYEPGLFNVTPTCPS